MKLLKSQNQLEIFSGTPTMWVSFNTEKAFFSYRIRAVINLKSRLSRAIIESGTYYLNHVTSTLNVKIYMSIHLHVTFHFANHTYHWDIIYYPQFFKI